MPITRIERDVHWTDIEVDIANGKRYVIRLYGYGRRPLIRIWMPATGGKSGHWREIVDPQRRLDITTEAKRCLEHLKPLMED